MATLSLFWAKTTVQDKDIIHISVPMSSSACGDAQSEDEDGPTASRSNALPASMASISICPLCCKEDLTALSMSAVVLSSCIHCSCRMCLVRWMDTEDASGRTSGPTCPFCHRTIGKEDILKILGRTFQPREAAARPMTVKWMSSRSIGSTKTRFLAGCVGIR